MVGKSITKIVKEGDKMGKSIATNMLKNKPDFITNQRSPLPTLSSSPSKEEWDAWLEAEKAQWEAGRQYFAMLYDMARQEKEVAKRERDAKLSFKIKRWLGIKK